MLKPPKVRNINRRREAKGGEWPADSYEENTKSTATLAKTTQDKTQNAQRNGYPALVLVDDLS